VAIKDLERSGTRKPSVAYHSLLNDGSHHFASIIARAHRAYGDVYNDKTDILYYFLYRAVQLSKRHIAFIVSRAFLEASNDLVSYVFSAIEALLNRLHQHAGRDHVVDLLSASVNTLELALDIGTPNPRQFVWETARTFASHFAHVEERAYATSAFLTQASEPAWMLAGYSAIHPRYLRAAWQLASAQHVFSAACRSAQRDL
jgi:hypothetical protein